MTTLVAVALAVVALSVDPPKPWLDAPRPLDSDSSAIASDSDADSLSAVTTPCTAGETLGALLSRRGVSSDAVPRVMDAASALDDAPTAAPACR